MLRHDIAVPLLRLTTKPWICSSTCVEETHGSRPPSGTSAYRPSLPSPLSPLPSPSVPVQRLKPRFVRLTCCLDWIHDQRRRPPPPALYVTAGRPCRPLNTMPSPSRHYHSYYCTPAAATPPALSTVTALSLATDLLLCPPPMAAPPCCTPLAYCNP